MKRVVVHPALLFPLCRYPLSVSFVSAYGSITDAPGETGADSTTGGAGCRGATPWPGCWAGTAGVRAADDRPGLGARPRPSRPGHAEGLVRLRSGRLVGEPGQAEKGEAGQ